nr:putative ribonuclease H-like domain-containing protein [Tanacetum cinerariifolium]
VIEFGDSYEAPAENPTTGLASDGTGKNKGRTVTLTADDMRKRKNDVKVRTTLLLSLPEEHQLRFTKGSETLEQMFNKLQLIVSQQQFMDVEIEQDDLNQNLDDLYNHLKVYESEVQKKSEPNSQNMAVISSAKHSSGNEEINIASVSTASINVSTASVNIGIDEDDMEEMDIKWNMALLSMRVDRFWKKTGKKISIQGTDVARFDKSKVEHFNCHKMGHFAKECRAPRSQDIRRRDNYRQGSKVKEQAPKALMNHALTADEETPTEFALMAKTNAESKVFDSSLCSKAWLAQVEARLVEHKSQELKYCEKIRVLEFKTESRANCIESLTKDLELLKKEKGELETKLTGFQTASKDLDSLLESQRLDKNKEGLGYNVIPPPPAQIYSPPKKDMSWTGLPEFKDDTITNYSRPSPVVESSPDDAQNKNPSVTTTEASPSTISPKPFIKFVKVNDSPTKSKTYKVKTAKKPPIKYAEQYRKPIKKPNVRGNQKNWNNLKSHHLGTNFVMKKNACFNCGDFNHLAYDCSKRVKMGTSRPQNNTHKNFTPRPIVHRPYRPPMRPNMNAAQPNRTSFYKPAHSYTKRPFQRTSAVRLQYRGLRVPPAIYPTSLIMSHLMEDMCLLVKEDARLLEKELSKQTFFLKSKDETSGILRKFITEIENLKDLKVKIIRCDNGKEFRNKEMNDFCLQKGIKREFSNARTPQQNGVAERRNRTLIEAART